jgi:hypothetical protein
MLGAGNAVWANPLHSPLGQTVPSPTSTTQVPDDPGDGDGDDDDDVQVPVTPTTIFLIATPTITPTMTMTMEPTVIVPTVPAVPTVTPTIPVPAQLPVTGNAAATPVLPPFWLIATLLIVGLALIWGARRKSSE